MRVKRQFAELFIERDQYPMLDHYAGEDILINRFRAEALR